MILSNIRVKYKKTYESEEIGDEDEEHDHGNEEDIERGKNDPIWKMSVTMASNLFYLI